MVSRESTVEFSIILEEREYKIRVLKYTNYVSLYDLANCCDFDSREKLGSKKTQELLGAFKRDAAYENLDPLYYLFNGDRSDPMKSTFIHPDIVLYFISSECRPEIALWLIRTIREALIEKALNTVSRLK